MEEEEEETVNSLDCLPLLLNTQIHIHIWASEPPLWLPLNARLFVSFTSYLTRSTRLLIRAIVLWKGPLKRETGINFHSKEASTIVRLLLESSGIVFTSPHRHGTRHTDTLTTTTDIGIGLLKSMLSNISRFKFKFAHIVKVTHDCWCWRWNSPEWMNG